MKINKEYTREDMLQWLENHFKSENYEVKLYSQDFSPARVPLYCMKEGEFRWNEVPGKDDTKFKSFLSKYVDFELSSDVEIKKAADNKSIICSDKASSVTLTHNEKDEKISIEIKDGKTYLPMVTMKKDNLYIFEEVVVELTTERNISKNDFFPLLTPRENEKIQILEASPVRFYQYYFPKAKLYYAYPDYVEKNNEFNNFKNVCIKRGIGLLEISKNGVKNIIESQSLFDEICEKLVANIKKDENIRETIGDYLENYLHYLVYYPDPIYRRSAIIDKKPGKISRFLIDKLDGCEKLTYGRMLTKLASNYRDEPREDFDIVLDYTSKLWEERLGLEYPKMQRHLEEILLRDEKYRDHFIHQFQVFLIGAYILDKMYSISKFEKVLNKFESNYKCKIEDAWLAAATFHDFNYGLQNFDVWLKQFFVDTLSINNEEAKDNLNILNLDSAMVRESLNDIIRNMVELLNLDEDSKEKANKFFYEKSVRDRNHGLLSALAIVKLSIIQNDKLKINPNALLQASLAIACHDEDIWEALCGCKGYLRINSKCEGPKNCDRHLFPGKKLAVYKQNNSADSKCEVWEQELMEKSIFNKISFTNNPLIFLLIFCDSVQEEGRITSMSIGDESGSNFKEFDIRMDPSIFNKWAESNNKLGVFEKKKEEEKKVDKMKREFAENNYKLSEEAKIFKMSKSSNKIWKITDKKIIYEIVEKGASKESFCIKPQEKECVLNQITVTSSNIKVSLTIDGLYEKAKELSRVSCALEDKSFKVHLQERDTDVKKDIVINGNGGG